MAKPHSLFSPLAALLFLAVAAWVGAGLYAKAERPGTVTAQYVTVQDSAELQGIAIRNEVEIQLEPGFNLTAEEGRRLSAGEELARREDGSALCCQSPGVFFSRCDGFEYLGEDELCELDAAKLQKLLAAKPGAPGELRLVADYAWYFAAFVQWSETLPESGPCLVLFPGFDAPVEAQALSLSPPERGQSVLLLRLTAGGEYLSLRKSEAQLLFSRYSGYKLPCSALHSTEDGGKFVYILSSGALKETPVDIIYSSGDFVLVSPGEPVALREGSLVLSS